MSASKSSIDVSIVGLGYIGLPTAAVFAAGNLRVVGVDLNEYAVEKINRGEIHIQEPGLLELVKRVVKQGNLRATTVPESAEAFIIAVPTPFKSKEREPDLSYIKAAVEAIAPVLQSGNLVILESTSPVGTTERMATWLAERRPDLSFPQHDGEKSDIRIAYCPERVLPGKIIEELQTNDRVIGGITRLCSKMAVNLYDHVVSGECFIAANPRVAEMAKLSENSFRDVNIAFANELSLLCDKFDINVWDLIELTNKHPRVNILQPGPGVGGHCIAVDPWFLISASRELSSLIRTARQVNDGKTKWVIERADSLVTAIKKQRAPGEQISIACYGITFKPDVDDLRESPALNVVSELMARKLGDVLVIEPNLAKLPEALSGAEHIKDVSHRVEADLHILLVRHSKFSNLQLTTSDRVFDTIGLL